MATQRNSRAGDDGTSSIALGQLSELAGFRIRKIQNRMTGKFTETLAPFSLRPGSFSCLSIISANSGLSQKDLACVVGLDKTKTMQIIDSFEERGLACRRPSRRDRRSHALHLTDRGEKLTRELFDLVRETEETVLTGLSADERKTLMGLLDKILLASD